VSCVQELPHLVEVVREHQSEQVELLTVNFDVMLAGADEAEALKRVQEFQNSGDLPFPTYVFNEDDYERLYDALNLPGPLPVTLAFDANGLEVARCEGPTDRAGFRQMAEAAISGIPSQAFPPHAPGNSDESL